jgi:hypothetical protein
VRQGASETSPERSRKVTERAQVSWISRPLAVAALIHAEAFEREDELIKPVLFSQRILIVSQDFTWFLI